MGALWVGIDLPEARANTGGNAGAATARWIVSAELESLDGETAGQSLVRLPDSWNRTGRFGLWRYTARFEATPTSDEHWGLYVPRMGNRVAVVLNGRGVGQLGSFEGDLSDHAQRPHFFHLPRELVRQGSNMLELTVQGERARYAGLSTMMVGQVSEVRAAFFWRELFQTWGSFAIVVIAAAFALMSGVLALVTRDRIFVLFALASLFCGVRTSYALVASTPFDFRTWNLLVDLSFAGYLACLCLFCLEILRIRRQWIFLGTCALIAVTMALIPLYAFGRHAWARQMWTMTMVTYSFAICVMVVAVWWKTRTTASRILAAAGGLSVLMGLHDHIIVFYTPDGYSAFALVRYSLLLFMVAMAWVLTDRYAGQTRRENEIRAQLATDLEERTAQLLAEFDAKRQFIEAAAHQRERERLIHDLHDGMGLQLHTLLSMVEGDRRQSADMAIEVRTAIDQMRMLVDSSTFFDGSFMELLGHIRYRVEGRLARSGIELVWRNEVPNLQHRVDAPKAIALQHLIFELATNVIKHSAARKMEILFLPAHGGGGVMLEVRDDGRGYPSEVGLPGLGRRSILRRVADLQGAVEVEPSPGVGCRYVFRFPVPFAPGLPTSQLPLT